MAGLNFTVSTEGAVTVSASTPKTLLQVIAPTNQRVKVKRVSVSFNGTSASDPAILVQLLRQTTAGTMTAATPRKDDAGDDETIQTTAQHTATAEPTASDIIWESYVPAVGGAVVDFPEPKTIKGGTRLGLKVSPGATPATVSASATIDCEE